MLDLEKADVLEIKLPIFFVGSWRKQGSSRKISTSTSLTTLNPLTVWITTNCGKFLKRWEYQTTLTCLLRNMYEGQEATVRTRHGTTDWFKIEKGVHQGCILSPCLFNLYAEYIIWNSGLNESQAAIKTAGRNINKLRWYCSNGRKWRGTKVPLDEGERGEWKSWLKSQHSKHLRSWHLVPSLHGK